MAKWTRLEKGIRFREHPERKLKSGHPDRYFAVRVRRSDGSYAEKGLGWQSNGQNLATVREERDRLMLQARQSKPITKREERAAQQEEDSQQAEEQERLAKENITMADFFWNHYMPWAEANKAHTRDDISRFKTHLAPVLGDKPMQEIAALDLERVKKRMTEAGRSPATVRHALAIVRQCFSKAIVWGMVPAGPSPTKGVKMPRLNNRKERELSAEEEARLLDALKPRSEQVWAMALVSLYSGMRFAEIAGLAWQCIDFDHDIIHVRGKGDRSRTIPMHHAVKEVLLERRSPECEPTDLIFPAKGGGQQARISALYYRVVQDLGLNENRERRWRVDFHSLRHSWGSRAARLVPITDVRDILGHTTLAMTTRYAKGNLVRAAVALQALGQEENNGSSAVVPLKESNSP